MQHAGLGQLRLAQQRQGIGARATGMDDHRLAGLPGRLQMQAEGRLLQFGGFRLVVIIQAGLTDRHDLGMLKLAQQPVERRSGVGLDVQRVHADRTIDIGITLGQGLHVSRIVDTHADAQEVPDPALTRRVERRIQGARMFGEIKTVKVAMGIYKHKKATTTSYGWDGRTSGRRPGGFRSCCERYCHRR